MTGNDLLRAVGAAEDADLILAESAAKKKARGIPRYIWVAAAAAAVFTLALAVVPKMIKNPNNDHYAQIPTTAPTEENTESPTQPAEWTSVPTQSATETAYPTETASELPTQLPVTAVPTETITTAPTQIPTERPTAAPTTSPTERPTERPTVAPTTPPTERPTERPTAVPTARPTPEPTPVPTTQPTEIPTPTPTVPVATGAPLFDEYGSEAELIERIKQGGGVYDSIHYYYAPKRAPRGSELDEVIVSDYGIQFQYGSEDGSERYSFLWMWNTDPDEYIERFIHSGTHYEKVGKYYTYNLNGTGFSVLWEQDGALFLAGVPSDSTLEDLEYFCDARLVTVD